MEIGHLQAVGMIRTRTGKVVTELGQGDPRLPSQTAAAAVRAQGRTTAGATVPATNFQLPKAADALCCAHSASPMRFDILFADIGIYGVFDDGIYSCGMSRRQAWGVEAETGSCSRVAVELQ